MSFYYTDFKDGDCGVSSRQDAAPYTQLVQALAAGGDVQQSFAAAPPPQRTAVVSTPVASSQPTGEGNNGRIVADKSLLNSLFDF
jgi:hypothetical protein